MKRLPIIFMALAALSSCELRPLYIEGESTVKLLVITDWTQLGSNPEGASIYFYPVGGGKPYIKLTNSVTRQVVDVPSGYYNIRVMNRSVDEFGTMSFIDMDSFSSARAYLKYKSYSWPGQADTIGRTVELPYTEELTVSRTDMFKVKTIDEYETEHGSAYTLDMIIDSVLVTPRRTVYDGTISIAVDTIQSIYTTKAYITGMAGDDYLATRTGGDSLATVVIEPSKWKIVRDETDYTKGHVTATFRCFGNSEYHKNNPLKENNKLVIEFVLVNKERTVVRAVRYEGLNISQDDKQLTVTIVDEIPIVLPDVPPDKGTASGFDVDFTDWPDEEIDIPVGV